MAWADTEPGTEPLQLAIGASRAEYDLCKQIPGCTLSDDGIWRVALTWPGYVAFRTIWQSQPIEITPQLQEWETAKWSEIQLRYGTRDALAASGPFADKMWGISPPGLSLTPIQDAAAEWFWLWRRCILADEAGNGKTPPVIMTLKLMHETGEAGPVLVVCPDSAPLEWQRKLGNWAPELRTVVIGGSATARRKAIAVIKAGDADVGIICWQNLHYHTRLGAYPGVAFVKCDRHHGSSGKTPAACEVHLKDFNLIDPDGKDTRDNQFRFRTVVLDEAHHGGNPKSKQTRAAWWLAWHAENVFATTGTLQRNDVGELWPVLRALEPLAFPSKSRYLDLYAQMTPAFAGRGQVVLDLRADTADAFHLTVDPYFRRIPKQIARAGQPVLLEPEFRYPPMTPKQAAAYKAVTDTGLAELRDCDLVTGSAIAAFTRQCQLASAMVEIRDGEDPYGFTEDQVRLCKPSSKVGDLIEFLADNPGQWLVSVNSPQLADLAGEALDAEKITWTKITGGMSFGQKDYAAQQFQRGETRVIFVTEAGSEAIDLYAAEGIAWLQPEPSFVERAQKTGRVDRRGQTHDVRSVWFLTPGTPEIRLYELGLEKEVKHESVVQDKEKLAWLMTVQPGEIIGDKDNDTTSHIS